MRRHRLSRKGPQGSSKVPRCQHQRHRVISELKGTFSLAVTGAAAVTERVRRALFLKELVVSRARSG